MMIFHSYVIFRVNQWWKSAIEALQSGKLREKLLVSLKLRERRWAPALGEQCETKFVLSLYSIRKIERQIEHLEICIYIYIFIIYTIVETQFYLFDGCYNDDY